MWAIFFLGFVFLIGYLVGRNESHGEVEYLKRQLWWWQNQPPRAPQSAQAQVQPAYPTDVVAANQTQYQPSYAQATTNYPNPQVPLSIESPSQPRQQLDNALILLYLGAFLFLSAVGLFMAVGGLSGTAKSLVVLLLVGIFYGGGLQLYGSSRLRPAGTAFMGIGMVLLPFFGLSLYTYVFDRTNGPLIWSLISVASLGLYFHAWQLTRQTLVTYLMLGAALSLFESSVSLIGLETYYFTYVLTLFALLLRVANYKLKLNEADSEPLTLSSTIFVPLSIMTSLVMIPGQGLVQFGFGLLLAASYYACQAIFDKSLRAGLILLSDSLAMVALLVLTAHWTTGLYPTALMALGLCLLHLLLMAWVWYRDTRMSEEIYQYLMLPPAVLSVIAVFLMITSASLVSLSMAFSVMTGIILYLLSRRSEYLLLSVIQVLLLPLSVMMFMLEVGGVEKYLLVYAAIAIGFAVLYKGVLRNPDARAILKASTYMTMGIVALLGLASGDWWAVGTFAVLSLALLFLGRRESSTENMLLLDASLITQTVTALLVAVMVERELLIHVIPLSFVIVACVHMASSVALRLNTTQASHLRYGGMVNALLGALCVIGFVEISPLMILSLFVLAGMLYYEARLKTSVRTEEISYGVAMLASQWLLFYGGLREFQVYSHLWAAFFAALAYYRFTRQDKTTEDMYTVVALSVLTVPLILQSLVSDVAYGYLLIIEQLAIVLIGMALNRPFIRRWGVWVSVIAVLYQLRELTFVALGFLAIVLIVIALRVLLKSEHPPEIK